MTTQQLHLFNGLALVLLIVVSILTRATDRRIADALAGGTAAPSNLKPRLTLSSGL